MEFITPTEVWQLAALQLLFYLFLALSLIFYLFWRKPIVFVVLTALFSAAAYAIMIWQARLPWRGLVGDEIFVIAFLQKVAAGYFWSDFFYSSLPPFYPPLYFWLVGGLGWLLQLHGINTGHLGVLLVLSLTPLLVYLWQRSRKPDNLWLLILVPLMVFVVKDWSVIIVKPYEFISAVLAVLWTISILEDIYYHRLDKAKSFFYGISGGLLFMTFYFWFFIILLAVGIFKLMVDTEFVYYFKQLSLIGLVIFLVTLPFILPLGTTYWQFGAENWQPGWFIPEYLDTYLPFLSLSVFGLIAVVALVTFVWLRELIVVRALGSLLLACYLWQGVSLFTIYFWDTPFLPSKPFEFLGGAILSITAAYGVSAFLKVKVKNQAFRLMVVVIGLGLLALQLPFGYFFTSKIGYNLALMKQHLPEEDINLFENLKKVDDLGELTVLSSGVPEMSALLPLDYYISHNIHFSHPAANWSQRYYFVNQLAHSPDAQSFYQTLRQAPFDQIDALLLFKGEGFYPINFWIDNYPLGGRAVEIRVAANLLDEQYFVKVFEDRHFVFLKVNP